MDQYVALDVSLKEVSVCVLDAKGVVVFEGRSPSDPASLVGLIQAKAGEGPRPDQLTAIKAAKPHRRECPSSA